MYFPTNSFHKSSIQHAVKTQTAYPQDRKKPSLKLFFSFNLFLSLGTVCQKNLVGHKMHFMTKISCAQTVENIMPSCACFSTALYCTSSSAYIV